LIATLEAGSFAGLTSLQTLYGRLMINIVFLFTLGFVAMINIIQNPDTVYLLKKMNQLSNNAYEAILNNNYKYLLSILKESHKIKSSYAKGVSNNAIEKSFNYLCLQWRIFTQNASNYCAN
jgi:hypothetical protein